MNRERRSGGTSMMQAPLGCCRLPDCWHTFIRITGLNGDLVSTFYPNADQYARIVLNFRALCLIHLAHSSPIVPLNINGRSRNQTDCSPGNEGLSVQVFLYYFLRVAPIEFKSHVDEEDQERFVLPGRNLPLTLNSPGESRGFDKLRPARTTKVVKWIYGRYTSDIGHYGIYCAILHFYQEKFNCVPCRHEQPHSPHGLALCHATTSGPVQSISLKLDVFPRLNILKASFPSFPVEPSFSFPKVSEHFAVNFLAFTSLFLPALKSGANFSFSGTTAMFDFFGGLLTAEPNKRSNSYVRRPNHLKIIDCCLNIKTSIV